MIPICLIVIILATLLTPFLGRRRSLTLAVVPALQQPQTPGNVSCTVMASSPEKSQQKITLRTWAGMFKYTKYDKVCAIKCRKYNSGAGYECD